MPGFTQNSPTPRPQLSLRVMLQQRAREQGGVLAWEDWMRAALYEPELGYYARRVRQPGRGGDFSTSATLSNALGSAIATWARRRARELRLRGKLNLIEIGAGGGQLAETVLKHLGWVGRMRASYSIVEISPPFREAQKERLATSNVRWFSTPSQAIQATGGQALVFSNELVDAFPCIMLMRNASAPGGWLELFLKPNEAEGGGGSASGAEWLQTWQPMRQETLARCAGNAFMREHGAVPAAEGQVIEVHAAYQEWLARWVPELKGGAHLTIDYGAEAADLYHRRPRGTLRGYFQHLPIHGADVFARPGHQDLTADVNFTDLQGWGEALGLRTTGLQSQRDFILRHAPRLAGRLESNAAASAFVVNPFGAGEAFQVLEQVV